MCLQFVQKAESHYTNYSLPHLIELGKIWTFGHRIANFDLVSRLSSVWDARNFAIHKVKSHVDWHKQDELVEVHKFMGNAVADRISNLAMKRLGKWMHDLADKMYKQSLSQDERLSKTLKYMAHLNRERKCLELYKGAIPSTISELPVQNRNLMGEDAVKVYLQYDLQNGVKVCLNQLESLDLQGSLQGVNLARHILCWAETLVWPSENHEWPEGPSKVAAMGGCPGLSSM